MFRKKRQSERPSHPSLELLAQHVSCAEKLSHQQREFVTDHIAQCPYCCNLYGVLCNIDEEFWEEACRVADIPKKVPVFHSSEEAFASLWQRIEMEETTHRRQRRHTLAFRIGSLATAACILIAIGVGWMMMQDRNSSQFTYGIDACSGESLMAFAELVTDQGRKPLEFNQPVKTSNQPQEILLGGMHRVVMNANTSMVLAAEPVVIDTERRVRYEIQLPQGEIYVEVVPGHPFAVKTNDALLAITGTKFNVQTIPGRTDLTLLKGSVRFSTRRAEDKYVHVPAGRSSSILAQSAPSPPKQTDALAATAWARDFVMRNTLAHVQPGQLDEEFLESVRNDWTYTKPPDLDKLDYEQWRDKHREWFKQQFPWIFEIQEFLKDQHSIEADYIDLLMISGDIWQFHYSRTWDKPIPGFNPFSIEQIAKYYNLDEQTLGDVPKLTRFLLYKKPRQAINPSDAYRAALHTWRSEIAATINNSGGLSDELILFTSHANLYLTRTRTAAYLWIQKNRNIAPKLLFKKEYSERYLNKLLPGLIDDNILSLLSNLERQNHVSQKAALISLNLLTLPTLSPDAKCRNNTKDLKAGLVSSIDSLLEKIAPDTR